MQRGGDGDGACRELFESAAAAAPSTMQPTRYATRLKGGDEEAVAGACDEGAVQQTGVALCLLVRRWNVQHSAENEKETQTFHKFLATA